MELEEMYHTQEMMTDHSWVGAEIGKTDWDTLGKALEDKPRI